MFFSDLINVSAIENILNNRGNNNTENVGFSIQNTPSLAENSTANNNFRLFQLNTTSPNETNDDDLFIENTIEDEEENKKNTRQDSPDFIDDAQPEKTKGQEKGLEKGNEKSNADQGQRASSHIQNQLRSHTTNFERERQQLLSLLTS